MIFETLFETLWVTNPIRPRSAASRNRVTRIETCSDVEIPEDMVFTVEPGNMVGPTRQGINALVAQDPGANWDPTVDNGPGFNPGGIVGGCMAAGTCVRSPRWRAAPVFDIENYMSGHRTGRGEIIVSGFVGIYLEGMVGNDVEGYLTTFRFNPSASNLTNDSSSFLRSVILVR